MTSAKKDELFEKLAELSYNPQVDTNLLEILTSILYEIHTNDNTRPEYCRSCGRISYFDPLLGRHVCRHCDKR